MHIANKSLELPMAGGSRSKQFSSSPMGFNAAVSDHGSVKQGSSKMGR